MSFFNGLTVAEPIEVFHKNRLYQLETDPNKVNLTIGGKSFDCYESRNDIPFFVSSLDFRADQRKKKNSLHKTENNFK